MKKILKWKFIKLPVRFQFILSSNTHNWINYNVKWNTFFLEKCQLSCVPIQTHTVWVISFTFSYSFRILNKSNASRKMKMSFRIFVVFLVFGIHSIFVWIYICRKGRHIKNDEGLIAKLIQNRTKSVKLRWKYNKSRMIWKLSNGIMLFLFVFKMKY